MRKPVYAICEQQRRRSACASAHKHKSRELNKGAKLESKIREQLCEN